MGGGDLQVSRFFSDNIENDIITLSEEDSKHLAKVLRAQVGEIINICDGCGTEYKAEICEISSKSVKSKIIEKYLSKTEPKVKVTIFQGLPKGQKIELIIQKCVEIGAFEFVPVETVRSVVKLNEDKGKGKEERWNKISMEAAKQSERGIVPKVYSPITFDKAIEIAKNYDLAIIPYEKQEESDLKLFLKDKSPEKIAIFIGPEGGFEEQEIKKAIDCGIKPVSLGKRILRTETAPLTALSVIMYEFDW